MAREQLMRGTIVTESYLPFTPYRLKDMEPFLEQLTKNQIRVLHCLIRVTREKNISKICREEIEKRTGIAQSQVSTALKKMERIGAIKKLETNIYILNPSIGHYGDNSYYNKLCQLWAKIWSDTLSPDDRKWVLPKGAEKRLRKDSLPLTLPPRGREEK